MAKITKKPARSQKFDFESIELKKNRIFIPGVGTVEKKNFTEEHYLKIVELCKKEGIDANKQINRLFKFKSNSIIEEEIVELTDEEKED